MLNNNQLFENLPPDTSVGTFSAEDLESNNSIIFSIIDSNGTNHNHLFNIETNGTLRTSSILDFESNESLQIHVKATDTHNSSVEKTFKINVLNIVEDFDSDGIEDFFDSDDDNDSFSDAVEIAYGSDPLNRNSVANKAPNEILISNNTFKESQPIGLFIGKLSATDPDKNSTHTFSFFDHNNSTHNQLFEIDSNHSLRTKSLFKFSNEKDYFIIRVNAKDEYNASYVQNLYIQILKDENQNIRLGKPDVSIDAIGRVTFISDVSIDSNEPQPTVEFLISETEEFSNILFSVATTLDQNSAIGSSFKMDENKSYYAIAKTTHNGRFIISDSTEFNTHSIPALNWWDLFEEDSAGWRKSDWFGTFLPHHSGWIYHHIIGWLYSSPGQDDDFWFWSNEYGWLWTKKGIYPFLYRHNKLNWLYILGYKDGKAVFHDYSEEQNF